MSASKAEIIKQERVKALLEDNDYTFVSFKGALMYSAKGTRGLTPMNSTDFGRIAYQKFGGVSKSHIMDLYHMVELTAPDWSHLDNFVGFYDQVWDTKTLDWATSQLEYVYSSTIRPNSDPAMVAKVQDYLLQLSGGDEDLAHDYIQMWAPLLMHNKPNGVIWCLGYGANGKSAFLDAWYMILGKHFAEQSLDMIEDGRSAPALRGVLGNIVREASEKRIEDDKHYKNIGAHESIPIRILGTHDTVEVDANFHSIMNANNVPVFEDKSMGSRRRTLLVPFPATFTDDPYFKARVFTPEFLGAMLHLVLEETKAIAEHGYQWSAATQSMQDRYNTDANTAEAFARFLDESHVVGFKNYALLRGDYESWCADRGMVALGRSQLKRAMENILHYPEHSRAYRQGEHTIKRYLLPDYQPDDVTWLDVNSYALPKAEDPIQLLLDAEDKRREW